MNEEEKIDPATLAEIQTVVDEPDMVTYYGLLGRPGMYGFMVELEYTKFKPDTDANDDFHMAIVTWPEGIGLKWVLIIFHQSEQGFAESILWKHGLRRVKEGYVGIIIGGPEGAQKFPIKGPRCFCLENHGPNVVYTNDPVKMQAAWDHEKQMVEHFFEDHKKWFEDPANQEVIEAYWKKHPEKRTR